MCIVNLDNGGKRHLYNGVRRGPHRPGSTCITEDGTLSKGDPCVRVGDLHITGRMKVPIT